MKPSMSVNGCVYRSSPRTQTIRALIAALMVAAAGLAACTLFPHSSNPVADQKITADVEARFERMTELDVPSLLKVQTIDRVVYLSGTVSSGLQRRDAELSANQVQGVAKVVNSIAIDH